MANSSSVQPWSLRMPAGSLQEWLFTFTTTAPGGATPYSITGWTWEYVARPSQTDLTVPPLIDITTTSSAQGIIAVTATATVSQILLTIAPAATASLTPGTFFHTLWSNPGSSSQFAWMTGELLIVGNPQP